MDWDELKLDLLENGNCLPETTNLGQKVEEVGSVDKLSNKPQQMDVAETDRPVEERVGRQGRRTPVNTSPTNMSQELQTGYRILVDLMHDSNKNANWPFMESLEVSNPSLLDDYKKRIEKPIWLKLMKQRFDDGMYSTITEFVSDFRTMLENCYRYNGPDHYISKRAQKLETMLEQKLTLLSRELRARTSIAATSGQPQTDIFTHGLRRRPKSLLRHDSTLLLSQLREAELQRERELRRQMILDRRAEKESLASEIVDWEDSVLFQGKYKNHMKAMWELPQIGLFLFLCQGPLNIGEVMHFELERCFVMPRESSTMQLVMTSLLSTPFQRLKLDKKTLMPYKVWEQKLRTKLQLWYKLYTDTAHNAEKVFLKLGVEPQFFAVVGERIPLERKKYHELSYYRRVCIVKALCDHCLHSQDSLRETIELHPIADQREYVLGTDAEGQRYIHFPQFCGADLRIYRQAPFKYPKLEIKIDTFDNKRKFPLVYKPPPAKKRKKKKKRAERPPVSPVPTRQRPSRLRQTPKTIMAVQGAESSSSTSSDDDDVIEGEETTTDKGDVSDTRENNDDSGDNKSADQLSSCSDITIPYCDRSDQEPSETTSAFSSRDCSRESSPYLSPRDLGLRRSARLEHRSDASRESSPLIYGGLDLSLRRSTRKLGLFKDINPQPGATRNLNNFLFDENSNSNSSAFGESCQSVSANLRIFKSKYTFDENSVSSSIDDENSCDTRDLFTNSYKTRLNNFTDSVDDSQNIEPMNVEKSSLEFDSKDKKWTESLINENSVSSDVDNAAKEVVSKCDTAVVETSDKDFVTNVKQMSDCLNNFSETRSETDSPRLRIVEDPEDSNMSTNDVNSHKNSLITDFLHNGDVLDNHLDNGCKTDEQKADVDCISDYHETNDLANNCSPHTVKASPHDGNGSPLHKPMHDTSDLWEHDRYTNKTNENVIVDNDGDAEMMDNNCDSEMTDELDVPKHNYVHESPTEMAVPENLTEMAHCKEIKDEYEVDIGNKTNDVAHRVKKEPEDDIESYGKTENEIRMENNSEDVTSVKTESDKDNDNSKNVEIVPNVKIENDEDNIKSENSKNRVGMEESADETEIKQEMDSNEVTNKEVKKEINEEVNETKVKAEPDTEEESDEEEQVPDASHFQLISDSVEELRCLAEKFAEPEPVVIRRGKKEQVTKPPPRKRCVVLLHGRLQFLLRELDPWESKLAQAMKRARIRMRKEKEDYVEPLDDPDTWNTTDEETQSGTSGDESEIDNDNHKKTKLTSQIDKLGRGNISGANTPVKLEDFDETDISQRGRLRKRRIIPNNVEDQFGPKKMKSIIKTEPQSSVAVTPVKSTTPSKTVLVNYSDILKQLKAITVATNTMTTGSQIVIQTAQGPKTLLTGVLPTGAQNVQSIRLVSPPAGQSQSAVQPVKIAMATAKQTQHPMIQHLLARAPGSVTTSMPALLNSALRPILPQMSRSTPAVAPRPQKLLLPQSIAQPDPAKMHDKVQLPLHSPPGQGQGQTAKVVIHNQTSPYKTGNTIKPPIVAMPTATMLTPSGKVKYYAANASTLPINVVQQLLATRGAKLQSGPNQESILFIPMEEEGNTRNVVSHVTDAEMPMQAAGTQMSPQLAGSSGQEMRLASGLQVSATHTRVIGTKSPIAAVTGSLSSTFELSSHSKLSVTNNSYSRPSDSNQPGTSDYLTSSAVIQGHNIVPPSSLNLANTLTEDQTVKTFGLTNTVSSSEIQRYVENRLARYPSNETVRTLLDKRKYGEEKLSPVLTNNFPHISTEISSEIDCSVSPSQTCSSISDTTANQEIAVPNHTSDPHDSEVKGLMSLGNQNPTIAATKPVQCVYTSISPAKLNSLLLQTSAAGAKSFPSLIRLPSKAVLDSAVKAVVTAVPTTLPTVNIKVPSPTTLPSVAPRRNVTKTIQTMRSPIPVAPKLVSQSSGHMTLSVDGSAHYSTPSANVAVPVTNIPATQAMAVVQNIGGKNVLTKIVPQTLLTSQGLVQGYVTPKGFVIPKTQPVGSQPATALLNQMGLQTLKQVPAHTNSSQVAQNQTSPAAGQAIQNKTIQHAVSPIQQSVTMESTVQPNLLPVPQLQTFSQNNLVGKSSTTHMVPIAPATSKTMMNFGQPMAGRKISKSPVSPISAACIVPKPHVLGITPSLGLSTLTGAAPLISTGLANNSVLKSPIAGTSFILPSTMSSGMTPANISTSSLLNLAPGYIMQGSGMQLTSPVVNQLGLNLLQPGVPLISPGIIPPTLTIQPPTASARGLQQMVNPLLLSSALGSRPQVSSVVPSGANNSIQRTSLASAQLGIKREVTAAKTAQLKPVIAPYPSPTAQFMMRSPQNGGENLRSASAASEIVKQLAAAQLQAKMPVINTSMPEVKPVLLQQQLNTPLTMVGSSATSYAPKLCFPSNNVLMSQNKQYIPYPTNNHAPGKSTMESPQPCGLVLNSKSNLTSQTQNQVHRVLPESQALHPGKPGISEASQASGSQQQKLMLFSIGGQLVTGQGVPVTLDNGVLKLMPQAKVQIANQTLTPKQIQQTLTKIGQATNTALNLPSTSAGTEIPSNQVVYPAVTKKQVNPTTIESVKTSSQPVGDHSYPHKPGTTNLNLIRTVPNSCAAETRTTCVNRTSVGNVQFVLKPMVYSSGYIVCPRISGQDSESGTKDTSLVTQSHINTVSNSNISPKISTPSLSELKSHISTQTVTNSKPFTSFQNVNGQAEPSVGQVRQGIVVKHENMGDSERAKLRESIEGRSYHPLLNDESSHEKEAAMNLLTFANQAIGRDLHNSSGSSNDNRGK